MKKSLFAALTAFVLSFLLISCVTTKEISILRPSVLDMNGANSVGILPFSRYSDSYRIPIRRVGDIYVIRDFWDDSWYMDTSDSYTQSQIINYITKELTYGLSNSNYLKLVSSTTITNAYNNNNLANVVDVYLAGQISSFALWDETIEEQKKVEIKNKRDDEDAPKRYKYVTEYKYKRHINFNFVYEVIDADTEVVLGYNEKKISDYSSSYNYVSSLPDPMDMIEYELDCLVRDILKDIQPYTVYKSLKFLDVKTKDKSVKENLKVAKRYLDANDYMAAYDIYYSIYENTKNVEAGYNAAIALECSGYFNDSEELLSYLYSSTQNKKVKKALDDIRLEISYNNRLAKQFQDQDDRSNKAKEKAESKKLRKSSIGNEK